MKSILMAIVLFSLPSPVARAGYYDPFVFHVEGSCQHPRSIQFHQTLTWQVVRLGPDAYGRPVYAEMALQLFSDHTYWFGYDEVAVNKIYPDGTTEGDLVFQKKGRGQWTSSGNRLVVTGLFSGRPVRIEDPYGSANGILARFVAPIHDRRIMNAPVVMGAGWSNIGPYGMSVAQYCHP